MKPTRGPPRAYRARALVQPRQAALQVQAQACFVVLLGCAADHGGQMENPVYRIGHERGPGERIRQIPWHTAHARGALRVHHTVDQRDGGQAQIGQGQATQTLIDPGQEVALQQVARDETACACDQDVHHGMRWGCGASNEVRAFMA